MKVKINNKIRINSLLDNKIRVDCQIINKIRMDSQIDSNIRLDSQIDGKIRMDSQININKIRIQISNKDGCAIRHFHLLAKRQEYY